MTYAEVLAEVTRIIREQAKNDQGPARTGKAVLDFLDSIGYDNSRGCDEACIGDPSHQHHSHDDDEEDR